MAESSETLILRAIDSTGAAFESVMSRLDAMHEHIRRIGDLALGNVLGGLGVQAISDATGKLEEFGSELISINASTESLHQTLTALYGTSRQADEAFQYMTQFALTAPFTRQSIIQAGTAIASFGGNIEEVLPSLGNLASVMGTTMPIAAQALLDAYEGRFSMMQRDLHVTKAQLVDFGLQIDSTGHVIQSSLLPAFEKFVNAHYPEGMALQMKTFNGQMSNLQDQLQYLQITMGKPIFEMMKAQMSDLIQYLIVHKADVQQFATTVGIELGKAASFVFGLVRDAIVMLPRIVDIFHRVMADIQPPVQAAWKFIGDVIQAFVNWFNTTALPAIETAIGTISKWWSEHGDKVKSTLSNLMDDVRGAFNHIGGIITTAMNLIGGTVQALWGAVEVIFATAFGVITGNFDKFHDVMTDGANNITIGVINAFAGLATAVATLSVKLGEIAVSAMIPLANKLFEPWTALARGVRTIFDDIATQIGELAGTVVYLIDNMNNYVNGALNTLVSGIAKTFLKVPGFQFIAGHLGINVAGLKDTAAGRDTFPMVNAIKDFQTTSDNIKKWLEQYAPGINQNQKITAGRTVQQARADVDKAMNALLDPFTAAVEKRRKELVAEYTPPPAPPKPGEKYKSDKEVGKDLLDGLHSWLNNLLAAAPKLKGGGGGGGTGYTLPPIGDLNVPGLQPGVDPREAAKAARELVAQDKAQFELDLKNGASMSQLLSDIRQLQIDQKAAGLTGARLQQQTQAEMLQIAREMRTRALADKGLDPSIIRAAIADFQRAEQLAGLPAAQVASDVGKLIKALLGPTTTGTSATHGTMKVLATDILQAVIDGANAAVAKATKGPPPLSPFDRGPATSPQMEGFFNRATSSVMGATHSIINAFNAQRAAEARALATARQRFQVDLQSGSSLEKIIADIKTVLIDLRNTGVTGPKLQLEANSLFKQLIANLHNDFTRAHLDGASTNQLLNIISDLQKAERAAGWKPSQVSQDINHLRAVVTQGQAKVGYAAALEQFKVDLSGASVEKLVGEIKNIALLDVIRGSKPAQVMLDTRSQLSEVANEMARRFSFDAQGGATVATLVADVKTITAALVASGMSQVTANAQSKTYYDQIVSIETAVLNEDRTRGAKHAELLHDIANILRAEQAAGYSRAQIRADQKRLLESLNTATKSAHTTATEHHTTTKAAHATAAEHSAKTSAVKTSTAQTAAATTQTANQPPVLTATIALIRPVVGQLGDALAGYGQTVATLSKAGPQGAQLEIVRRLETTIKQQAQQIAELRAQNQKLEDIKQQNRTLISAVSGEAGVPKSTPAARQVSLRRVMGAA